MSRVAWWGGCCWSCIKGVDGRNGDHLSTRGWGGQWRKGWSALVTMDTLLVFVYGGIPLDTPPLLTIGFAEARCWPPHCAESAAETPLN